ncbi:MAG: 4-hydroxy-tetrahydrodipicolinate reductase [Chloroherpetonaceae bacterium]|nr:4-hydroxy-tetrahydrodipicolinate reductase [Chloroherpetonaceae bacterium]
MEIRVAVCGAAGRMGREVVRAILDAPDMELVAAIDRQEIDEDAGMLAGSSRCGVCIEPDLRAALARTHPDVMVDFTVPESVDENLKLALEQGVRLVVGTTGLTPEQIAEAAALSEQRGIGGIIAPNFAIGAVLMMQFAAQAAKYLPDVEIIELHHDRKLDAPSGTALLTAQRVAAARREAGAVPVSPPEGAVQKVPGARGAQGDLTGGVPVHSVRLPGLVAHQEVLLGGLGQMLTIRHDSFDRRSFMPGVLLAIRRVRTLDRLIVGLEHLL